MWVRVKRNTIRRSVFEFDEFEDLQEIMEDGPHWDAIHSLEITCNYSEGQTLKQLEKE